MLLIWKIRKKIKLHAYEDLTNHIREKMHIWDSRDSKENWQKIKFYCSERIKNIKSLRFYKYFVKLEVKTEKY